MQVKIFQPRLILKFLCFLALIIHALGLRDKGNIESTEVKNISPKLFANIHCNFDLKLRSS